MTKTVSHVDALFGGQRLRFELQRDRETIDKLESAVSSVSACWGRFNSGDWTMKDVRTVLALAHPHVPVPGMLKKPELRSLANVMREAKGLPPKPEPTFLPPRGVNVEVIDRVLAVRPLATYAPLAGAILTAAFIGLPAAAAVFDESAPLLASEPETVAA